MGSDWSYMLFHSTLTVMCVMHQACGFQGHMLLPTSSHFVAPTGTVQYNSIMAIIAQDYRFANMNKQAKRNQSKQEVLFCLI